MTADEGIIRDAAICPPPRPLAMSENEAYCFRCKAKKEMKNPTQSRMKNGRPCMTGPCVTCGTSLWKILPAVSPRPAFDPARPTASGNSAA